MAEIYRNEGMESVPAAPREPRLVRRISWGAVWGGVMVALGVEALLVAFGLFIGFAVFNPANGVGPGFTAWSWAWFWITSFIALFAGGYTTTRLGAVDTGSGGLNGLVTWGLTTIGTVLFFAWVTTSGLAAASGLINAAASAVPNAAANAASQNLPSAAGSAGWEVALLLWIGIGIGALAAFSGGKKGESPVRA